MLVRPVLSDEAIAEGLSDGYGLSATKITFLPVGDAESALFGVETNPQATYLLKVKPGPLRDVVGTLPGYLRSQGIPAVMAPIATKGESPLLRREGWSWLLYPFVAGRNGFVAKLSRSQWVELGRILRAIHDMRLPPELRSQLPEEDYSPQARAEVAGVDEQIGRIGSRDPTTAGFVAFWKLRRDETRCILQRATDLCEVVKRQRLGFVPCHADLHAGNVLVGDDGQIAILDWDAPVMAPKERDLMFIGGGVGGVWHNATEQGWFHEGYGSSAVNQTALAYYRYQRIVADLAVYSKRISTAEGSLEERRRDEQRVREQFEPRNVVEIAHQTWALVVGA